MKKNHAKTYPSLAQELASRVLEAVSGSSTSDSFASFDRATWLPRTSQLSLLAGLTSSSVALPKAGMTRSGSLYELPTLERLTDGSGSSSSRGGSTWDRGEYPTPTAEQYGSSQNGAASGHVRPTNGTPSLSTWARESWATPTASDGMGGPGGNREGSPNLRTAVSLWPPATAQDASSSSKTGKDGAVYGEAHAGTTLTDAARQFTSGRPDRTMDPRGASTYDDSLEGLPLFDTGGSIPASSRH